MKAASESAREKESAITCLLQLFNISMFAARMLLHRSMTTRSKSSAREWTAARKKESWQRISTRKGICNHVNATTVQHFHICMLLHRSMTTRSKSSARESTVARRKLKLAANQHEKSNLQSRDCCNCSTFPYLLRACYFTAQWRLVQNHQRGNGQQREKGREEAGIGYRSQYYWYGIVYIY